MKTPAGAGVVIPFTKSVVVEDRRSVNEHKPRVKKKNNEKQMLLNALKNNGIHFTHPNFEKLEVNKRCCLFVLESIADRLKSSRLNDGAIASIILIGNGKYKKSAICFALSELTKFGIVERKRNRNKDRDRFEQPARNYINSTVINRAIEWSKEWAELGPRSKKPTPFVVELPVVELPISNNIVKIEDWKKNEK